MTNEPSTETRRRFLEASTATTLAAALGGCVGGPAPSTGTDDPTGAPRSTDRTGSTRGPNDGADRDEPAATVVVGPQGDLRFDPATVHVDPGDAVRWTWASATHNVVPTRVPDGAEWTGTDGDGSRTYDDGHAYRHVFETAGTYEYVCAPHESAGMTGTVVVGGDPPATERVALEDPATIAVGPDDALTFHPGTDVVPVVRPGTTVTFAWESDDHSVTVDAKPDGATWTGTGETLHDAGFEHVHEFAVEGRYEFSCGPHRAAGMRGALVVESR